jgi:hypothetical protein
MPKYKDAHEVLSLLCEALEADSSAKERGTVVGKAFATRFQEFAEALRGLEPREALRILCMDTVGPLVARQVAPFNAFPTKKVRFNVFPQSEEKLERVKKAYGKKTTRDAIDTVLELLLNRLPLDYWNHKSEVVDLLSKHLPNTGVARPVSLAMNSLGYALLQDLAEMLEKSQGTVLEAAVELSLIDLKIRTAKTKEASKVLSEFLSQAHAVEKRLQEIEGDGPISSRFGNAMVVLENLHSAIESNINEEVPIDPDDISQQY